MGIVSGIKRKIKEAKERRQYEKESQRLADIAYMEQKREASQVYARKRADLEASERLKQQKASYDRARGVRLSGGGAAPVLGGVMGGLAGGMNALVGDIQGFQTTTPKRRAHRRRTATHKRKQKKKRKTRRSRQSQRRESQQQPYNWF